MHNQVSGCEFRVSGCGLRVAGCGLRVVGLAGASCRGVAGKRSLEPAAKPGCEFRGLPGRSRRRSLVARFRFIFKFVRFAILVSKSRLKRD